MKTTAAFVIVALGAVEAAAFADPQYTIADLGALENFSTPAAINSGGEIVGYAGSSRSRGFLWSAERGMATPGAFGSQLGSATGINDAGQICGYLVADGDSTISVVVNADGSSTTFDPLRGDLRSEAHGINNLGQVVGISSGATVNHAFIRSASGAMELLAPLVTEKGAAANALNDLGLIVGSGETESRNARHAVRWSHKDKGIMEDHPTDLGVLPGGNYSEATAINRHGQIVGYSETASGTGTAERAFLYDENATPKLQGLGFFQFGVTSWAYGINDSGQIVGSFSGGGGTGFHAFLITDGVMKDLNGLVPPHSGWLLISANAINASGQIAGYGANPEGEPHAFLLTPVKAVAPPPSFAPPSILIKGGKKVHTDKPKLTIKGTASGSVTSVTCKIGRKSGRVAGTANWKFKAALKPGKNNITVIAHGPGGPGNPILDSPPAKLTVIRQPRAPSSRLP